MDQPHTKGSNRKKRQTIQETIIYQQIIMGLCMALFQIVMSTLCKEDVTDKLLTEHVYTGFKNNFFGHSFQTMK